MNRGELICKYLSEGKYWSMYRDVHRFTFERVGEIREYSLPEVVKIDINREYVYLEKLDNSYYVLKFEEGNFLVIDEYNEEGIHLDSIACHVFGEE